MCKIKHCVKCNGFCWWDGDYCCTLKMAIIEQSPTGKFWAPIPSAFDANKCEYYDERENCSTENNDYYNNYIDFIEEYYELPTITDKEKLLNELGYKEYKKDVNGNYII